MLRNEKNHHLSLPFLPDVTLLLSPTVQRASLLRTTRTLPTQGQTPPPAISKGLLLAALHPNTGRHAEQSILYPSSRWGGCRFSFRFVFQTAVSHLFTAPKVNLVLHCISMLCKDKLLKKPNPFPITVVKITRKTKKNPNQPRNPKHYKFIKKLQFFFYLHICFLQLNLSAA